MAFEGVKNVFKKFRTQKSGEVERYKGFSSTNFDAGKYSPQFPAWKPTPKIINEDISQSRKVALARARDIVYNTPSGASALRVARNAVIGTGWRLSLKPDHDSLGITIEQAEVFAKKAERLFNTLAKSPNCYFDSTRTKTFDQLCANVFNGYFVNGDAFAVMQWKKSTIGLYSCVSVIDPIRVETPTNLANDATVKDGIKIDEYGEPIRYFIQDPRYKKNPEYYRQDGFVEVKSRTETGRNIMLHVFREDYPEQVRGITEFAPSMIILKEIMEYLSNENGRMALQASLPMTIKSTEDYETIMNVIGQTVTTSNNEFLDKYVGALQELYNSKAEHVNHIRDHFSSNTGAKVVALTPNEDLTVLQSHNHVDSLESFCKVSQKAFASGVGVDYATSHNDFSDTSYSAARLALGQIWEHYKQQKKIIEEKFALPFMYCIMEELIDKGWLEMPDGITDFHAAKDFLLRGSFISSGKPFIDPLKERNAQKVGMELGVNTLEEICAAEGKDYEEVLKQIKREQEFIKEIGVELGSEKENMKQEDTVDTSEERVQ